MKYIAYCRKSTDEPDRQILSIEAQVEELKEFAERENLEVVDFVAESKTAKEPGREKFGGVLKRIENGEAQGIISWHPDRLARNSVDGGRTIYLLDTGKLQDLKFPSFWFENSPQGKFMLGIAFNQSKYYVDNLSENIKRGNRQKLRRGEFPGKAPFGYLNDPLSRTTVVDRKRAKFVKQAFEMLGSGKFTTVDVKNLFHQNKVLDRWGQEASHFSRLKRILTNPFYYGTFKFCGELYEGKHKSLISKKLFDKVQEVLTARGREHKKGTDQFDFLGLIKCGECGSMITAEKHTKVYKRTERTVDYIYYRCSKKKGPCSQKYIADGEIEKQVRKILQKVSLPDAAAKQFFSWANEDSEKEKELSAGQVEIFKAQLKDAEEKLDRLLEGYLDKIVDQTDYQKKKNSLLDQKQNVQAKLDLSYPLPPADLHRRYDPVFDSVKRGLSSTLIGLPESHRSSFLKFVLYHDPKFLQEFIDTEVYKFVLINEPVSSSLDLIKAIIFKLTSQDIFSTEIVDNLRNSLKSGDSLLCLLQLEVALKAVVGQIKVVIILYETEKILFADSETASVLARIWGMHRNVPDPLISFIFIASPMFLEKTNDSSLIHFRGALEENIYYFPLFSNEEMAYTWKRSQKLMNISISSEIHNLACEISGGHPVLYRSLVHQDKLKLEEVIRFESDSSIDELTKTIWESLPIIARSNWNYGFLKTCQPIVKLGFIDNNKLRLPLLPPRQTKFEIDEKHGAIPQLTAQQKVVFDFLCARRDQVISREEIAQILWGKLWQEKYSDWAIDKCISDLKKRLAGTDQKIITLRGRGYKYVGA